MDQSVLGWSWKISQTNPWFAPGACHFKWGPKNGPCGTTIHQIHPIRRVKHGYPSDRGNTNITSLFGGKQLAHAWLETGACIDHGTVEVTLCLPPVWYGNEGGKVPNAPLHDFPLSTIYFRNLTISQGNKDNNAAKGSWFLVCTPVSGTINFLVKHQHNIPITMGSRQHRPKKKTNHINIESSDIANPSCR